jgi:very-short-patch-repair endonuclease
MRKNKKRGVRVSDLSKRARAQLDAMRLNPRVHGKATLDAMIRVTGENNAKRAGESLDRLLADQGVKGVKRLVRKPPPAKSPGEERFARDLRTTALPAPEREWQFFFGRKWRFDFAWLGLHLAVEIEGTTRDGGRHQRQKGFAEDCRKYNAAAEYGWTVLRYTPAQVRAGWPLEQVVRVYRQLERELAARAPGGLYDTRRGHEGDRAARKASPLESSQRG